jgi:hypothetical protein
MARTDRWHPSRQELLDMPTDALVAYAAREARKMTEQKQTAMAALLVEMIARLSQAR